MFYTVFAKGKSFCKPVWCSFDVVTLALYILFVMNDVQLELDDKGHGSFFISEQGKQLGEMEVLLAHEKLTVYHTEVVPEAEGKGLAKKLLSAMVDYARQHQLQVIPLCPYVHAQFRRHPDEYADIWKP